MTEYLDTLADPASTDCETGAPRYPSSSWSDEAAKHFDRGVFKSSDAGGFEQVAHDELIADDDYKVGIPEHTSSQHWDAADWVMAEDKPRSVESYKHEDDAVMTEKTTTTVEALFLASAPGTTSTDKPKVVAVATPHGDAGDCRMTKAGTVKVQSSDPIVMAMIDALDNASEVTMEVEPVTFLTDEGDVGKYNVLHSIMPV